MLMYGNSPFDLGRARGPPPYAQPPTRVYLDRSGPGELKDALAGPRREGGTMPFGPSRSESGFRTRTHLHFFCGKCEKVHPIPPPRRHSKGAPLLQFWHHEVTDCSAKTSVQKVEEPNQNLKGFQRDWWDRALSVFALFHNLFSTLVERCFHPAIKNFHDHL